MNYYFIKRYMDRLNINDVKNYVKNNNIIVSDNEIEIIYNYIKKYWGIVYQNVNNIYPIFEELKEKVSINTYNQLIILFKNFYAKYKNYLN